MREERFYKILDSKKRSPVTEHRWFVPVGDRPGKWMPKIEGVLKICWRGYHMSNRESILKHADFGKNQVLYRAEWRGKRVEGESKRHKIATTEARLLYPICKVDEIIDVVLEALDFKETFFGYLCGCVTCKEVIEVFWDLLGEDA